MSKNTIVGISLAVFLLSGAFVFAACPSADHSGNCFVDLEDYDIMAGQWLAGYDCNDLVEMASQWLSTDPNFADDMAYIPGGEFEMGDHHDGSSTIHAVFVDSFFMGRYETTNQQYCDYLNSAYAAGDIIVVNRRVYASWDSGLSSVYCRTYPLSTTYSQITFISPNFSVITKGGRNMSDDPMIDVSWYGATAYCNWRSQKEGYQQLYDPCDPNWACDFAGNGYRLPTEAEWEYAARGGENSPYYRFPWGDTISHSQANYDAHPLAYSYDVSPTSSWHPDWDDGIIPFTSVGGSFSANGYGLYDMTGNVIEWFNDWYDSNYYTVSPYDNPQGPASGRYRTKRGGSWKSSPVYCRIGIRRSSLPGGGNEATGFRVVLDLY